MEEVVNFFITIGIITVLVVAFSIYARRVEKKQKEAEIVKEARTTW